MKRVTGIGGVFFKAKDPEKLRAWYQKHLGLEFDAYGSVVFDCPAGEEQRQIAQDSLVFVSTRYEILRSQWRSFHDQLPR